MDLNEVAIFVKVIQLGSFSQAAKQLGMPNSTVSSKVSSLEARLGVTLIKRTTRKLFVTDAGRAFFERSLRGLDELKSAENEVSMVQSEPLGGLRVTAPVELGSVILPRVICAFARKYPKVALDFFLTDQRVDMVSAGVDLAIRAGELPNSSLKAKKLGMVYFAPFASQSYIKSNGEPEHPKELKTHYCLHFPPLGVDSWKLSSSRSTVQVPIPKKIIMNDLNGLKSLTLQGLGIALLPTFLCQAEIKNEKLKRILQEWRTNLAPIHFVYPSEKFLSPKVRAFIEVAGPILQEILQNSEL